MTTLTQTEVRKVSRLLKARGLALPKVGWGIDLVGRITLHGKTVGINRVYHDGHGYYVGYISPYSEAALAHDLDVEFADLEIRGALTGGSKKVASRIKKHRGRYTALPAETQVAADAALEGNWRYTGVCPGCSRRAISAGECKSCGWRP